MFALRTRIFGEFLQSNCQHGLDMGYHCSNQLRFGHHHRVPNTKPEGRHQCRIRDRSQIQPLQIRCLMLLWQVLFVWKYSRYQVDNSYQSPNISIHRQQQQYSQSKCLMSHLWAGGWNLRWSAQNQSQKRNLEEHLEGCQHPSHEVKD